MAITHGMDVAAVRNLATRLDRMSRDLDGVKSTTDRLTQDAMGAWAGSDAQAFRQQWQGQYRQQLVSATHALEDLAKAARRNADEQEQASGSDGGGVDWNSVRQAFERGLGVVDAQGKILSFGKTLADQVENLSKADKDFLKGLGIAGSSLSLVSDAADVALHLDKVDKWMELAGSGVGLAESISEGTKAAPILHIVGGGVGVVTDATKAGTAFNDGNTAAGVYYTVHGIASGVGTFVKPVGAGVAAWDTGVAIGTTLGTAFVESPAGDAYLDGALDFGAQMVGGDPSTDPAAAARLSERYEGIGGFGNFLFDSDASLNYRAFNWLSGRN